MLFLFNWYIILHQIQLLDSLFTSQIFQRYSRCHKSRTKTILEFQGGAHLGPVVSIKLFISLFGHFCTMEYIRENLCGNPERTNVTKIKWKVYLKIYVIWGLSVKNGAFFVFIKGSTIKCRGKKNVSVSLKVIKIVF